MHKMHTQSPYIFHPVWTVSSKTGRRKSLQNPTILTYQRKKGNQTSDMVIQMDAIALVFRIEGFIGHLSRTAIDIFPV